jgi:hypothetical protein
MKTPYFTHNQTHVAAIPKSGSSAIARAIHFAAKPNFKVISASRDGEMVERIMGNPGWQALAAKTTEPSNPIIPVRDPVERFRSACAQENKTADEALALLDEGKASQHFRKQSDWVTPNCRLAKFPEHLSFIATELGLEDIPPVNESETHNGPKPDLTPDQTTRVQTIYADDIALYASITEAGQAYDPASQETEPSLPPVPQSIANWRIKAVLDMKNLTDSLEAAIEAMPDSPEKIIVSRAWHGNVDVHRHSPTVMAFAAILNLADEQVDDMFRLAETFNP